MVGVTGSNHFSSGDFGVEVDRDGAVKGDDARYLKRGSNEGQVTGNNTTDGNNNGDGDGETGANSTLRDSRRKQLSGGFKGVSAPKMGMVRNISDGSRRFLRRVSMGATGVSQLSNIADEKDESQTNDENNNNDNNPENNPEGGGEDNESIDNESQQSSVLIRKFKYDVFSAHRKTRKTNLSIWHSPEFLKYFGGHFGGDGSGGSPLRNLSIYKTSNHSVNKDSQRTSASGDNNMNTSRHMEINQEYALLDPGKGGGGGGDFSLHDEDDNNNGGEERTQQQLVEEKIAKVMKNPLLRPIMNNKKEFDRLELNRDFVGCYLPDLALALRDNTSIRHVFILEGWLVTLSVKKAKILLGIIGSIPKLRTMSIRFPTKKFYFPVSTLIHLMSPATKLRRLKLWGIKIPRRRDVTMISNTLTLLHQLEEFWIFAKGDVNLNPLFKALTSLNNLEMVYVNQTQNTKYLQGGNYLAELCSAPSGKDDKTTLRSHHSNHHTNNLRSSGVDFSVKGLGSLGGSDNNLLGDSGAQLTGLSVTNILMVNAQMEALFSTLSNTSTPSPLLWLSLIDVTLRGNTVKVALAEMLAKNTTLQILTLHNVGLDDEDCSLIAEALTLKDPTSTNTTKGKKSKRKAKRSASTDSPKSLNTWLATGVSEVNVHHPQSANPAAYTNDTASVTSELTSTYSTCSEQQGGGADVNHQQQQQQPLLPHLTNNNNGDVGSGGAKNNDELQSQSSHHHRYSGASTRQSAAATALRKRSALIKLDIRKNDKISSHGYGAFINMIQKNSIFAMQYGVKLPLKEILTHAHPEIKQILEQLMSHLHMLPTLGGLPQQHRPSFQSVSRVSRVDRESFISKTM